MKIRLLGAEFFLADERMGGRTDRQTSDRQMDTDMTKLTFDFRNLRTCLKIISLN